MRLGLVTPILTRHPTHDAAWTADGGPDDLRRIAEVADRLGYHHLTCSEHVAVPRSAVASRGACYWDPLATFGFLSAVTTRIRFVTHVLVLGYHHPLAIAKRYGTLDRLCGGRLVLGVGVGTLAEEFALLGAPFADRGARFEDALRALRAAFGRREPVYEGTHHRFADVVVEPCGVQEAIPIWIGGRSLRSLRRAVALADGWDPFGLDGDAMAGMLARAHASPAFAARRTPLELVLPVDRILDPVDPDDREAFALMARRYRDLGATVLNCRFRHRSLGHYLEQLDAAAAVVATL